VPVPIKAVLKVPFRYSFKLMTSLLCRATLVALCALPFICQSQVGINPNGSNPHPSAGLDVDFDNKGFLPPRLTTAERDAISSPAEGLTIFNTDTKCLNVRIGSIWKQVCPDCDFPNPQPGNSGTACEGGNVTLFAATIPGANYTWNGPGGFTSSAQNPQITGINALQAGAYTVTASLGGCTTAPQTTFVVVNTLPDAPSTGSNSPVCEGSTISLSSSASGGVVYSWTGPSGFSSSSQNPEISTSNISDSGIYSASVTSVATGCSSAASQVSVAVHPLPSVSSVAPASRIGPGTVVLGATASSGDIRWYATPSGGTPLHTGTSFTTPLICTSTTYYAEAFANGCPSASRTPVTASVSKIFTVDNGCTLTDGLLSYWRMEGNSTDYYGTNNGTDQSINYGNSFGKVSQGGQFTSLSRIIINENAPLNTASFSFGMWIRTTSSSGTYQVIARRSASFMQGYGMYFTPNTGKLGLYLGSGADHQVNTAKTVNDGNWHFVMMTWDGGLQQGKIYCDNVLEGTLDIGTNIAHSGTLNLGYDVPNTTTVYSFVGSMDEIGFWNRVLTAQELTDLYNAENGQTMN